MTGADAPTCGTVLVQGVELDAYSDKVCKTSVAVMPVTNGYCGADGTVSTKVTCNKEKTQVTVNSYTALKCAGKAKNVYNFKSNDGKCHNPDTVQPKPKPTPKASPSPAPKAKAAPAPAPAPSGDASTNALATGFAVAGIIVSLVLM